MALLIKTGVQLRPQTHYVLHILLFHILNAWITSRQHHIPNGIDRIHFNATLKLLKIYLTFPGEKVF